MARGISLHVGINRVNEAKFSTRPLLSCENDAFAMSEIARKRNFEEITLLRGPGATFENVDAGIRRAAGLLKSGDIFLFTFAGHGCFVADPAGLLGDEPDDEASVLFDHLLVDDYLRRVLWPLFEKGVRIVAVADSCHSGTSLFASPNVGTVLSGHLASITVAEVEGNANVAGVHTVEHLTVGSVVAASEPTPLAAPDRPPLIEEVLTDDGLRAREITAKQAREHFTDSRNKEFYDRLRTEVSSSANPPALRAHLLTIGACADSKKTADGPADGFGAFTAALLDVFNGGASSETYSALMEKIKARLPKQRPTIMLEGPPSFSAQPPFTI